MGFKDAATVIQKFLTFCSQAGDERRVLYNLSGDAPDSLPSDLRFDMCLTDVSSIQFQIFGFGESSSVRTGRDVLAALQHQIDESARVFGIRRFVYCFDDRANVTNAKMRERHLRDVARKARNIDSYDDGLVLCTSPPISVDCAKYRFALDTPLPQDFQRVLATPPLLRRAMQFLCELLEKEILYPLRNSAAALDEQVSIKVSGYSDDVGNARVVQRVFCDRVFHGIRIIPSCGVGEAEAQCIYWMRDVLHSERGTRRFLLRANDSDALALALINMRELYDPLEKRIIGTIWLDLSSSRSNVRFVDIVRMWRGLKAHLADVPAAAAFVPQRALADLVRSSAPVGAVKQLRNDVETFILVAMLTGNDYAVRMPQLGPGTLFKFLESGLLAPLKANGLWVVSVEPSSGDMQINERALVALIARAYASISRCRALLAKNGDEKAARLFEEIHNDRFWIYEESHQKLLFDELARVTADENAWVVRKRDVRLPNYDCVRAHVRRAFFSLYYYSNVAIPARSFDAFACDNGSTLSLFGYKPFTSVSTVVADDDDDENSAMFALERRVLTRCPISGGEFQPFVREIQSAVRKRQFSPEEANQVKRENEKKQRLELALHMSKGPTEAWVDVPTRIANKLLGEAATKRRDELELTQSGEHGTFMPTPPKSVSPPMTKNEYEQESQE